MSKSSRRRRQRRSVRDHPLTDEQASEFLRTARDDLEFLVSFNYGKPSRTHVRVASSILRRLLHEGMYLSGWLLAGLEGQPTFSAVDLKAMVGDVPPQYIHYAYAGGATTEGASHQGSAFLVIPKAESELEGHEAAAQRISKLLKPRITRIFSLSEFCVSPSVISGNITVSRLDLVRYVANKLGGVHWDSKRGQWTDPVASRHRFLDEMHLLVGRLPAPLYEVVSIAQAVASGEDTLRFIERVGSIAPEQEPAPNVLSFREGRIGKYADMTFNSGGEATGDRR